MDTARKEKSNPNIQDLRACSPPPWRRSCRWTGRCEPGISRRRFRLRFSGRSVALRWYSLCITLVLQPQARQMVSARWFRLLPWPVAVFPGRLETMFHPTESGGQGTQGARGQESGASRSVDPDCWPHDSGGVPSAGSSNGFSVSQMASPLSFLRSISSFRARLRSAFSSRLRCLSRSRRRFSTD